MSIKKMLSSILIACAISTIQAMEKDEKQSLKKEKQAERPARQDFADIIWKLLQDSVINSLSILYSKAKQQHTSSALALYEFFKAVQGKHKVSNASIGILRDYGLSDGYGTIHPDIAEIARNVRFADDQKE